MNKKWKIFGKAVSILTISIGLFIIAFFIGIGLPIFSEEAITLKILSLLAISGGILFLLQNKAGWILTVSVYFSTFIFISLNILTLYGFDINLNLALISIISSILLLIGIFLISQPFRSKYQANITSTLIIVLIVASVFADRVLIYKSTPAILDVAIDPAAIDCQNKAFILQAVYERDQDMRKNGSIIPNIDSENLATVISLIENCGMPTLAEVSENQMNAIWLVFQHSNNANRKKYLPMLKVAADKGDLSRRQIALMEDRILMLDGKPQIYGTQIINNSIYNLIEPEKVNKRRAEIGFEPLEDYVSRWGIEFKVPQEY